MTKFLSLPPILIVAGLTLLAGCTPNIRRDRPYIESSTIESRPISEPVRAISSFSDGLSCMDEMLKQNHVPTTLITSKLIGDPSGKASVATKEIIITALSQMSRTSNAFRVVDFEIDPLRQDTVQTLTSLMLPSGQMAIPKPAIYVSGAISYVDQNVLIHNAGIGASAKNWEFGYSDDLITTVLGLELHLGDFGTRTLLTGVDSANELVAGNKGTGLDAGARIKKAGVQFTLGSTLSQGVGPAIRTLVDLGMIELAGKWARVPYWQCLALDQTHPEFQRQLRAWYDDMDETERVRVFETGLRSLGYYKGEVDGRPSPALHDALSLYQADHLATASGNLNFETYERLMKNYVASDGNNHFLRIGWGGPATAGALTTQPRNGQAEFATAQAKPIRVDITLGRREPKFTLGEALLLNVSTDQSAFLYCYYRDAKGALSQIYPNPFQHAAIVQAHRSVLIPDISNPQSFTIEMTAAGKESASCFAASNDITSELTKALGAGPLERIKGVADMEALKQRVLAVAQDAHTGTQALQWEVMR
ncbi:DUF4384 domain-containing protein [Dokdonella soli]|uniref:DUF4384 domain-containing protein n=1 Tax=Dokdonella soli TaxID=529810 RepID=A0ABP3U9V8_9GAMM